MNRMNRRVASAGWAALVLAGGIGCATVAPPEDRLAAAEIAVRKAEDSLAVQHAPLDLLKAREKLDASKLAMQREEYAEARRLAEQAEVDARLAEEKSRTAKAKELEQEMRESIEALERETERYGQQRRPAVGAERDVRGELP